MTNRANTPSQGDRIYWDGDMANPSRDGTVARVQGGYMDVEWDDGTMAHRVPANILGTPRWGYIADRVEKKASFWENEARQYRENGETERADMAEQVAAEIRGQV